VKLVSFLLGRKERQWVK
jgi:hypothetical protein